MRLCWLAMGTLGLSGALSSVAAGQRATTWATPQVAPARTASAFRYQAADSARKRGSWAQTGTVIGAVSGALVGGVAFAHAAHRSCLTCENSFTGISGAAIVGAALVGVFGAMVGFLVGSAIPR
jgi:hypothetical protein